MGEQESTQLRKIAEAVVKDNFLELFDLRIRPQGKKMVLTLVIDKKSGAVTLDDCTAVSREMETRLDEMDLIQTAYLLEVTSPGLDRPLRNLEDCGRFNGRLARFTLQEPLEGSTVLQGRLGDVREDKVELIMDKGKTLWVPFRMVKAARLMVEI